jgi:hypothetical protein
VESDAQLQALMLAVRELPGVKDVQAHLGRTIPG